MRPERDACPQDVERIFGSQGGPVRFAWAPYRLSPLGAHTDHQEGLAAGFTLDHGIRLSFRTTEGDALRLASMDFPGEVEVSLDGEMRRGPEWGSLVQGVVRALAGEFGPLGQGLEGVVEGSLPVGGVSSSAALQVVVLLALLEILDVRLSRAACMELVRAAERAATGVQVGLLDPAVILHGKERSLVVVDCQRKSVHVHRLARTAEPITWHLVESGLPRELVSTPYNERVAECASVARALGAPSSVLREVSPETYRRRRSALDPVLLRRAEHYFSEVKRVKLGQQALATGDVVSFGRLITASGDSLTSNYDCGTPETRRLLELVHGVDGVLGASYAGAGWGGLLHVLARPGAEAGFPSMLARYAEAFPEAGAGARTMEVGMGPGAHVG